MLAPREVTPGTKLPLLFSGVCSSQLRATLVDDDLHSGISPNHAFFSFYGLVTRRSVFDSFAENMVVSSLFFQVLQAN